MTTVAQWVGEARDHLEGQRSHEANQLGADYDAGSGTVTLANAVGNIGPGAWLSVGLNVMYVTAVNNLSKQAQVIAAQRGSVDADATAGALVLVNPRFTDFQLVREINRHLPSLSSPTNGLFQVGSTIIDYTGSVEGYDLTGVTGLVSVLEVRRQTYGTSAAWPAVETTMWDLLETAPGQFASGRSLRVRGADTGRQVQVVYAKAFDPVPYDMAASISTTGLPLEAEDIPPIGAAIRLMSGREISRNQTEAQGDTRRANEVPPGAVAASYRGLAGLWQQRVREESARLRRRYPLAW